MGFSQVAVRRVSQAVLKFFEKLDLLLFKSISLSCRLKNFLVSDKKLLLGTLFNIEGRRVPCGSRLAGQKSPETPRNEECSLMLAYSCKGYRTLSKVTHTFEFFYNSCHFGQTRELVMITSPILGFPYGCPNMLCA